MIERLIVNGEVAEVLDIWTHHGVDYAKVEGRTVSGFVEVPENPRAPRHQLVCEECGRHENPLTDEPGPLKKQPVFDHRGNAELMAKIHNVKTGHDPEIGFTAA